MYRHICTYIHIYVPRYFFLFLSVSLSFFISLSLYLHICICMHIGFDVVDLRIPPQGELPAPPHGCPGPFIVQPIRAQVPH